MPTCSFCGIICNPLLTSRLALMGLLAVLLILMTVLTWVFTSTNVHYSVTSIGDRFRHELLLRTKLAMATVIQKQTASAMTLATYLSLISHDYLSSFAKLQEQVRPAIFLAFSVLSRSQHISFFGNNGLFLSYGSDSTGTYLLYATDSYLYPASTTGNVSQAKEVPWNSGENIRLTRPWYGWFRQSVNESTGLPTGEATPVTPTAYWDEEPMKRVLGSHKGTLTWGVSQVESSGPLFTSLSSVQQSSPSSVGAISVGTPLASIQELLDEVDVQGGAAFLATSDGRLVAQTGISILLSERDNVGQAIPLATESNNALVAAAARSLMHHLASLVELPHDSISIADVQVEGKQYMVDSVPLQMDGITMICAIVLPHESIWGLTDKRNHITLVVLVALATCMGIVGCFFVALLTKGVSNEMRLRAALIQQLEETKKAETKSSHKSLVFANMSHDLRTPLAAILGLIDLSLPDTSEHSELESNLLQMKSCATNLLGILNTILDMSKIEAGKLLLQESNFDLVNALEEVADTFSVVGLKKGVEVVLDLSDGSVEKASWVVGDIGRVKQIMANLLSNGVKFTTEGHVVLRAWVKPLNPNSPVTRFNYRGSVLPWPLGQFFRSSSREREIRKLIEGFSKQDLNGDYVQIEFEVDDTGRGIPKERWKSVFENFVQVESSGPRSYDGTGLGLGIVRSLVRLMGGDIAIIDKDEPGEPGTRFHFNLIFKRCKQAAKHDADMPDIKLQDGASLNAAFGVKPMLVPYGGWHLHNSGAAPLFGQDQSTTGFNSPLIIEGVHVLLAMQGQAGKKVVKRWMERRGLQVWMIRNWEEFLPAVQIIKQEICSENLSMSGIFDPIPSENHYLCEEWLDEWAVKGLPRARSITGASMHLPPEDGFARSFEPAQSLHALGSQAHLLLVVDVTMVIVPLDAVCANLETTLVHDVHQHVKFKVVWLVNASTPSSDIQYLRSRTSVCHLVLHKPLYASRLRHVWCLLEELAGYRVQEACEHEATHFLPRSREKVDLGTANSLYTSLSCMNTFNEDRNRQFMAHFDVKAQTVDQLQVEASDFSFSSIRRLPPNIQEGQKVADITVSIHDNKHAVQGMQENTTEDQLPSVSPGRKKVKDSLDESNNALTAMHVLVAEDNPILQRLAKTQLIRLGATVECVDNGAEAARLVLENLYKSKVSSPEDEASVFENLPEESAGRMKNRAFDLVLMDCEMPILNGYEATQRIRSEEGRYGVRTPVIALTAHAMSQDEKKCIEAGMDFYLTKPLAVQALLNAVAKITGRLGAQSR